VIKMKNETKDLILHLSTGTLFIIIGFFILVGWTKDNIKFINCVDGDTFSIGKIYYRLAYVDTAEKGEPTYVASSKFTCDYLHHNKIKLKELGLDKYGRTLVEVNPQKVFTLNELLIRECLAKPFWNKTTGDIIAYYKYCK